MNNVVLNFKDYKFKRLSEDRILISFDRLSRFKIYELKYTRVFKDIIVEALIFPKYKKSELDNMDYSDLTAIATFLINSSLSDKIQTDLSINERLKDYELSIFDCGEDSINLLNNKINYKALLPLLEKQINLSKNLLWLKLLIGGSYTPIKSHESAYRFPIEKVVICEGITEEILLPEFARLLNYDFDKNGIYLISAGGKNQVVKLFYKYADMVKIPIFVLLDSDAGKNRDEILPRLQNKDKIYVLEHGEFEDILPVKLIEKALKYSIENISESPVEKLDKSEGTVHYLEEFYKTRGSHEFKKAEFAQIVKDNITGIEDVSEEFVKIINSVKSL